MRGGKERYGCSFLPWDEVFYVSPLRFLWYVLLRSLRLFTHVHWCSWRRKKSLYQPVRSEETEDSAWIRNLLGHLWMKKHNCFKVFFFVYLKDWSTCDAEGALKSTNGDLSFYSSLVWQFHFSKNSHLFQGEGTLILFILYVKSHLTAKT